MTEGSPVRLLLIFSLPMLIGNLFQQVYNLVDSVIVGQFIGAQALAAVGTTGSMCFLFFALCNGIGTGGGIITAQFFGSGDTRQVKSCISNTGYIMLFFPILVGIVAFLLAGPLLRLLNTPANIYADSFSYYRIMCVGLLFVSIYNYASSMLRALGDSKSPLYFLILSSLLNVGLDLLFVCVFHMGVNGAGYATIISQFVAGFLCILYAIRRNPYFKLTREDFRFQKELVLKIVKLGVPLSLQFSLIAISSMALQRVVNSFGAVATAAFTTTSRIEQLIHQPYTSLSSALSTYTGQNYGANRNKRVVEGYRKSILLMAIFSLVMLPFMQLFGRSFNALFVADPEVIEMGATALRITSLFYILLGMIYVVRGVLSGIGDSFFALFNGIVEVIGRFTIPVILTAIPFIGIWGIWWSVGVVWAISGFTAWLRYISYSKKAIPIN